MASIDVTLRTPDGQVYVGTAAAVVTNPQLTLASLVPNAFVSGVSTVVNLIGTGFQPGMSVQFGAVMATNVQVASQTSAVCSVLL